MKPFGDRENNGGIPPRNAPDIRSVLLFEDAELLAFDKPYGLAVQGGAGVRACAIDLVMREWGKEARLIHRLDRDTSGVLLVAKSGTAARKYGKFFEQGHILRDYRAVCFGHAPRKAELTDAIDGKTARTSLRTVERLFDTACEYSILELRITTGRTHQIRIHLAKAGNPLVGDDRYGDFALNKQARCKKLMLQAAAVTLPDGRMIRSQCPPHMRDFIDRLRSQATNPSD